MKKILFLILIYVANTINAQDFQTPLIIEKGSFPKQYNFTSEGALYLLTSKKALIGKTKDAIFYKYNAETLDLDYTFKPTTNFNILETSPRGEKVLFDDSKTISFSKNNLNVLNTKGEVKEYNGDEWVPKDFKVITRFISKDYFVVIGHEKGRKNFKKSKNKVYEMFSRDINTFESKLVTIELPEISTGDEEELNFQIVDHNNTSFTMIAKNFKDYTKKKRPQTQEYILAEYNYQGKLIKSKILITKINDTNLKYLSANTGRDAYDQVLRQSMRSDGTWSTFISYIPKPISIGNIYIDKKNKTYYTYSIIGSKRSKYGSGFLINKFDFSGKLIWTKKELIATKKDSFEMDDYRTDVEFLFTKNGIGFAISNQKDNYSYIFKISRDTGELILQKKFNKMKTYRLNSFGNFDTLYTNEFLSDYTFKKDFPKNLVLDINTLTAYILNDNFKKYIDKLKNTEDKLHLISNLNRTGVILIQADNKNDNFKLLNFKW